QKVVPLSVHIFLHIQNIVQYIVRCRTCICFATVVCFLYTNMCAFAYYAKLSQPFYTCTFDDSKLKRSGIPEHLVSLKIIRGFATCGFVSQVAVGKEITFIVISKGAFSIKIKSKFVIKFARSRHDVRRTAAPPVAIIWSRPHLKCARLWTPSPRFLPTACQQTQPRILTACVRVVCRHRHRFGNTCHSAVSSHI